MRKRRLVLALAGSVAVLGAGAVTVPAWAVPTPAVGAPVVGAAGSWGRAIEVPGLGALNRGGNAGVVSVSCSSAGNCAAGGHYRDQRRHDQGFVAVERHGSWGRAIEVPGLGALNRGGNAGVVSVSCRTAGNCAAAGNYRDGRGRQQGFVASEKNGVWGQAIEVPGLGTLNQGGKASVSQVSCGSPGNCTAAGGYADGSSHQQGFVTGERNGVWGQAIEVPGLGALNQGGGAGAGSVWCASAGNCSVVGDYTDSSGHGQGFVAGERNGSWWKAIEMPGLGALNQGGSAGAGSVSCASPGNCAAGGDYFDGDGNEQGFVASEKGGQWGQAIEVPGLGVLNAGNNAPLAFTSSVSCVSPGNCTAGGDFGWPYSWSFAASEKNGAWGQAIPQPGLGTLVVGRWASTGSVSCASSGTCAAGGDYENMTMNGNFPEAFVAVQRNGRWDQATNVPGLGALSKIGEDAVASVSCGSATVCVAAGSYTGGHGHQQGFVT